MAKTRGPLMSRDATGSVASLLIFKPSSVGTVARSMARLRLTPGRGAGTSPTPVQVARRTLYRAALDAWEALSLEQQAEQKLLADAVGLPVLAYWIKTQYSPRGLVWADVVGTWDGGSAIWS